MDAGVTKARRSPPLDGVRGVAILAVVMYHLEIGPLRRGGWLGVELFFVLSGYLITALLLREHRNEGSVSLRLFFLRRALRVLPAMIVLELVLLCGLSWMDPFQQGNALRAFPTSMLFIANWVKAWDVWDFHPLHHTWSLAIEVHFYLLWPLALAFLMRRRTSPRGVMMVAGSLALGFGAWRLLLALGGAGRGRIYHGTDTRAGALLAGCALAAALASTGLALERHHRTIRRAGWVGAGVIVVMFFSWPDTKLGLVSGLPIFAVAAAAVVAACAVSDDGLARVLRLRPLVHIGELSYGIYLWHDTIDSLFPRFPLHVRIGMFSGAAVLSWWLVEQPLLRLKDRIGQRTT